jgi:hypothetical protein
LGYYHQNQQAKASADTSHMQIERHKAQQWSTNQQCQGSANGTPADGQRYTQHADRSNDTHLLHEHVVDECLSSFLEGQRTAPGRGQSNEALCRGGLKKGLQLAEEQTLQQSDASAPMRDRWAKFQQQWTHQNQ